MSASLNNVAFCEVFTTSGKPEIFFKPTQETYLVHRLSCMISNVFHTLVNSSQRPFMQQIDSGCPGPPVETK